MSRYDFDILVLGAGCSGLSLGYYYAQHPEATARIGYLESRESYKNDRTWSFWLHKDEDFAHEDILRQTWSKWRFSDNTGTVFTQSGTDYIYCCLPSGRFYDKTVSVIRRDPRQKLFACTAVESVNEHQDGVTVQVNGQTFMARKVIDTRPLPQQDILSRTKIFQIFTGLEIETNEPCFDPTVAGLMELLHSDNSKCAFVYTLPFDEHTALIEWTIFATEFVPPQSLETDLHTHLTKRIPGSYMTGHKESGVLPMGFHSLPASTRHVTLAGMAGDNLKPSSGYGFLRIQKWSAQAAHCISTGRFDELNHHRHSDKIAGFMDHTFLNVLRNDMRKSAQIFVNIGNNMPGDRFARFMSDRAGISDYLNMIRAVPKWPFIKATLQKA